MIKQLVPSEFCLKCLGCCRFREYDSVWLPCLLDEEIQEFLDKDLPAVSLSAGKSIKPLPAPGGEGYLCALLEPQENKCRIYHMRPFECQLYPFLISLRQDKVLLTVDLNCPYVKENLKTPEFKEYSEYLAGLLNSPKQRQLLKDNPHIIQAYQDALDVAEIAP